MTEQQATGGRLPEWALMYALHDAFRRDLDALAATRAGPDAIRARWARADRRSSGQAGPMA